jgi:energy-coupling factor transporter transmembrane protein EcfT
VSLDALRIALQGAGFPLSPIQLAVQGLLDELKKEEQPPSGAAKKHRSSAPDMKGYVDRMNREYQRQLRIKRDDMLATEFITALVQMEILDGTV